jgi:hypothetical protein
MIIYNEALDEEVMELFQGCQVQSYTKVTGVFGKGVLSGPHLGNDIWPGKNNILYIVSDDEQSKCMLGRVAELRKKLGHEGIKAFVLPVEYTT